MKLSEKMFSADRINSLHGHREWFIRWLMTFEKENIGYLIVFMIIGGVLGSAIGTLLTKLFPSISVIKSNLTGPIGFSVEIISFSIKLNLAAIIGLLSGILIFKKV